MPGTLIPTDLYELSPNATWNNFLSFIDAVKGANFTGMSELKKYFHRFGYLQIPTQENFTDVFDDDFESAIINYQKKLGLIVTGKLDTSTVTQIISPRCGVTDHVTVLNSNMHVTKHYAYFYGEPRWGRSAHLTLKYAFSNSHMINYMSTSDVKDAFRRSFSRWASVIPVNFTETDDYSAADIKIGFHKGDHGDGEPFDGVLGVLAHAFSPENGRLHLDEAETWAVENFKSTKSKVAVDLESVATHEIGHILGLAHSSVKDAIMYPSLNPRTKKVDLKIDDVEGIQALYGSNPNFHYNSLMESDLSSVKGCGSVRFANRVELRIADRPQSATQVFAMAKDIMDTALGPHHVDSIEACQILSKAYIVMKSLKALDEGYSSKNYVRKFLRSLHPKWRAKVTTIEESKDLTSLSLDELIRNLKVQEMIIKKDYEIVKAKVERKSLALKAKKESSDEECSTSGSEDEDDPNHLVGECPKPPKDKNQRAFVGGSWSDSGEEDDENVKNKTCLVAQASSEICLGVDLEPDEWIKDSGCSKHMTGNRKLFSSYKAYNGGNVIFGSNLRGNIIGKGQIYDNKYRVTFFEHDSEITKDGKIIASNELVKNLPKLKFDQHLCDACKNGKQAHASHKDKNIVSTTRCLELLHLDLFGPSAAWNYRGNCYTLVIVDDYSKYTWTRFLKDKTEAFDQFKIFSKKIQNQLGCTLVSIRIDHGREFDNEVQFGEFCNANGITHNFLAPRTPQSNGVVERKIRTLQEMSRTMLNDQSLPQKFWCNAVDTLTYILNRILIRAILGKTPYELLKGRKHTLDYFRVFGSKCFILNTKDYPTKFDSKSYEGIFLGYSQNSKAYIILNKHTRKVKESLNVIFNETPPPSKTSPLVDDDLDEEEAIKITEKKPRK
nr:metalloendoproteinase 1-MMP-like [Tanacetum cinerariifolium]